MIAERYKFYNVNQEANEDVKSFVARLKVVRNTVVLVNFCLSA